MRSLGLASVGDNLTRRQSYSEITFRILDATPFCDTEDAAMCLPIFTQTVKANGYHAYRNGLSKMTPYSVKVLFLSSKRA